LSGVKVEVIYTNCDTLVKEEDVRVYFSRAAVTGDSWFARWRSRRALVFVYDPGGRAFDDMPLPSITHTTPSTVLISMPEDVDVLYQSRSWQNLSVDYALGNVH
jgi:hypothetical protein